MLSISSEHFEVVKKNHPSCSMHEVERIQGEQFASWFAERVSEK